MQRTTSTLQPRKGTLSPAQTRLLQKSKCELLALSRRGPRVLGLAASVCGFLWLLTMLASDTRWEVITVFWTLVAGGIVIWLRRDFRRDSQSIVERARQIESALERNEADVFDIRARAYAEFQEIEDEGACYAFDLGDGKLVFVCGQEFFPTSKFPSLDFSLVYPLDEGGRAVDMFIEKRAPRSTPARTIPSSVKKSLEIPEHLSVIRAGSLDQFEDVLEIRPED